MELSDEGGDPANVDFRLTKESISIIESCSRLASYEEFLVMFANESEANSSEACPHGHQEEAIAFMMHGILPTEPCPICGEIPKFGNTKTSLNFQSDGPVKGVDGQAYRICPKCGEDTLELEGRSLAEWGWNINCLNCEWTMKQAEALDIGQYLYLMEEVRSRIESINQLIELPGIIIRTRVESMCLQLRMLLELIVFSSLVSNKDVWQRSQKELQSSQDISKKLKELKRLHPKFFPQPVDVQEASSGDEPADRQEGYLSEERLIEVYGRLGNILHAVNPIGGTKDFQFILDEIPNWIIEVVNLLECHKVYLYHHPNEFYLIKMFGDMDGELQCVRFKTTSDGKTKCAWPDCVSSSERLYCEYIQSPWRACRLPDLEPNQTQAKEIADEYDECR